MEKERYTFIVALNPAAFALPATYCGVSGRMGNIIMPYGSKVLRRLSQRSSIHNVRNATIFTLIMQLLGKNCMHKYHFVYIPVRYMVHSDTNSIDTRRIAQ